MKTAEIKEITVEGGTSYNIDQYKEGNGLYLVNEKGLVNAQFMFYSGVSVIFLCYEDELKTTDREEVEGKVNESLLLKSLAILNGQKFSEL